MKSEVSKLVYNVYIAEQLVISLLHPSFGRDLESV